MTIRCCHVGGEPGNEAMPECIALFPGLHAQLLLLEVRKAGQKARRGDLGMRLTVHAHDEYNKHILPSMNIANTHLP